MVIDTDVLIWYMKGNEKAYKIIEKSKNFFISVVTYIELVQGMRNKNELNNLRRALHVWNSKILYISEEISVKAMFFVEQHFLSHSMQLADALIGAQAGILLGNRPHELVRMEAALHEGLSFPAPAEGNGPGRGFVAVPGIHHPESIDIH